ncbi:Shikimate 5-dehydrogenase I alpha [Helicobacter typhlonius]|uniref:Shikimate dehydrogenase (NADP(+)) n=3 Tax=Helicobacteraceae TaxID=72293 RepID=A0A0S4PUI1_9HELI|nr:shikimate dehydrogenase [Helicobacter typhlonius]TLD85938.1 shikimate dehydrogenase [Helicobacter sp. MIT 03-1616]CUU39024.1 Shikimate 5-dehydrogenase I alpha [Helicobacter typhlonius]HCD72692.1 shikimate dehydrogenase [Helicobacter sp.]
MLRFFAVYGNPIAHSKSPLLHNHVFTKYGLSACYGRILLENGEALRKNFDTFGLSGANITIPFKENAYTLCDEVRGIAQEIGACNTWVRENERVIGYNTDAQGFYECIKDYHIKNALVIGAGGAAKAVAIALKAHNIHTSIINRSAQKLTFFADKGFVCYVSDEFKPKDSYDIIINTTSAGLGDTHLPCPKPLLESLFANASYAFDLIYGKQTPFLALAADSHLICDDGKDMLIYQAAIAFKLFCQNMSSANDARVSGTYIAGLESTQIAQIMREALL